MEKLLYSAGKESVFMSRERGRMNQFYFITTKEYGKQAEAWLEDTMNYFLQKYGIATCKDHFSTGSPEMPRSKTKAQPGAPKDMSGYKSCISHIQPGRGKCVGFPTI